MQEPQIIILTSLAIFVLLRTILIACSNTARDGVQYDLIVAAATPCVSSYGLSGSEPTAENQMLAHMKEAA
ncbi:MULTISPECIES: hypothetical protein [Pseudomonas]|uniref:hypothetical protein n=1 Tax=Pseudomonas TaxID=286 RepID=UPI001AE25074|nr:MULTISPECIES: hypothetical protein [unclassified Pseudomonas]MBP1087040.1 hypothetical protein [Pseudomonas sp. PvP007]MBP1197127.1 hypothetical protein [Pseudomonas sp. PvP100]